MSGPAHSIRRIVEFYETDMAGIVHFSNFFRFMEACEHSFLRGFDEELRNLATRRDVGWPRVHAHCDYRSPARFGDVLDIHLFIDEVRPRSVRYRFEIFGGETLVAEGRIAAAHVKIAAGTITAIPIPEALARKLVSLGGGQA